MMKSYYITTMGNIKRKENTLLFEAEGKKIPIPIEQVYSIYALAPISVSAGVFQLLSSMKVTMHMFGYYGNYIGSFVPKKQRISGDLTVRQASLYLDKEKRLFLAKKFVEGSLGNMIVNVGRYSLGEKDRLEKYLSLVDEASSIEELMGFEAGMRKIYYKMIDNILPDEFKIIERKRRPPSNMGNSMISFANGLLYSAIVAEIYHTPLNASISFLHEPMERRYSLSLDVSEIFKPFIADRAVIYLIKRKMIRPEHFETSNGVFLNRNGNKIFARHFSERLKKTVKHRTLGRKVSYRQLIRIELYKIVKHILGMKKYKPFVIWW